MRVVLGMSGGVDSAVSALLLKEKGYEVIGVTFRFIDDFDDSDAKKLAKMLNIEHHTLDYRKEFKENVINDFLNKYKNGITPNPCVNCNRNAKMKYMYQAMKDFNCDCFATGHYAEYEDGMLVRAEDLNKDQSYFLSCVDKEILDHVIFPLNKLSKPEVRKIAEEKNLIVANKKDSFDVCFIKGSFSDFIKENLNVNEGNIVDVETKEIIGKHLGLMNYTIGQRKNVGISGNAKRHYVCGKDSETNTLYVAFGDDSSYLLSDEALITNVNFISSKRPLNASAKFRYRSENIDVLIDYIDDNTIRVKYVDGKAITPGQTCSVYLDNECICGGTIKQIFKDGKEIWYLK